jgi:hypothetical protein
VTDYQQRLAHARARKARKDALAETDEPLPEWLSGDDRVYVINARLAASLQPLTQQIASQPPDEAPPLPEPSPESRERPSKPAQPREEAGRVERGGLEV